MRALWAPGTAPPSARDGLLVVSEEPVVRGQDARGFGRLRRLVQNPWVISSLVGAAIAIPIAVDAHNDDEDSAS